MPALDDLMSPLWLQSGQQSAPPPAPYQAGDMRRNMPPVQPRGILESLMDAFTPRKDENGNPKPHTAGDIINAALWVAPGFSGLKTAAPKAPTQGIRAYHGSPNEISAFDRPAYFSPDRNYAAKFGNVHEVQINPKNPYYTNNEAFIEGLRSFPERAAELRANGHDAAILSGSNTAMEPLQLLGGPKQPQIYSLDPSIVSKVP